MPTLSMRCSITSTVHDIRSIILYRCRYPVMFRGGYVHNKSYLFIFSVGIRGTSCDVPLVSPHSTIVSVQRDSHCRARPELSWAQPSWRHVSTNVANRGRGAIFCRRFTALSSIEHVYSVGENQKTSDLRFFYKLNYEGYTCYTAKEFSVCIFKIRVCR